MTDHRTAFAQSFAKGGFGIFSCWSAPGGVCRCPKGAACVSPGKHPIPPDGFKSATTDARRIATFMAAGSEPNYGLVAPTGVVMLDVDGDDVARLADLEAAHGALPATMRTRTANGEHIMLRLNGEDPGGQLFGFVTRRHGDGYVIGPGSVHPSGFTYEWNGISDIAEMPAAWVQDIRQKPLIRVAGSGELPTAGHRHDWLVKKARHLSGYVRDPDELLRLMMAENARLAEPKSEEAVEKAIGDVLGKFDPDPLPAPARDPGPRSVIQAGAFVLLDFPAHRWRVHEMLPSEGFAVIVGTDKEGKSLLALQAALCVAAGLPFLGKLVEQAPVLLIEEEGSSPAFQDRLQTQAAALSLLHRLGDLPLHVSIRQRWRLDSEDDLRAIEAEADAVDAGVIFIGPLSQLAAIDENANKDMNAVCRRLLDMLARRGGLLVLTHHRRKAGDDQPRTVREFFDSTRGGNALMAAVDAAVGVRRDPEQEQGLIYVMLRDGPGQRLHIAFDSTQLLIHPVDAPPTQVAPYEDVERVVLEAGEPVGRTYVASKLGTSPTTAGERLDILAVDGRLSVSIGPRNQKLFSPATRHPSPPKGVGVTDGWDPSDPSGPVNRALTGQPSANGASSE